MIHSRWARRITVAALVGGLAGLPGAAAGQGGCGASYTVRSGDTLAAIAERCETSVQALMQANPIVENAARISIGWELTIPDARASLGPDAEIREPVRSEAAEAALVAGTYEVQPGESLASIATTLQVSMRDLLAANEGIDPFSLRAGQTLHLPTGAANSERAVEETQTEGAHGARAGGRAVDEIARQPDPAGQAADKPGVANDRARSQSEPPDIAERLTLEGRVQSGVECPVLETPEGVTYSLVSTQYGFAQGEYVRIEGETIEMSFCSEGRSTVRVTSMTSIQAPQDG